MTQYYHSATDTYVSTLLDFTLNEVSYPFNWLSLASPDEILALGLTEVTTSGTAGDPRYYDNSEVTLNGVRTITATRKSAEAIKALIWQDIQAIRDAKVGEGYKVVVETVDKWFHSDPSSRIQQLGLVMLGANIPPGLQWKTMDGTFITMTQTLAGEILTAAATSDTTIFAVAEAHKAAMTAEEFPETYDFTTGWPTTYAS